MLGFQKPTVTESSEDGGLPQCCKRTWSLHPLCDLVTGEKLPCCLLGECQVGAAVGWISLSTLHKYTSQDDIYMRCFTITVRSTIVKSQYIMHVFLRRFYHLWIQKKHLLKDDHWPRKFTKVLKYQKWCRKLGLWNAHINPYIRFKITKTNIF